MATTLFDLPIEIISEICKKLTYHEMRRFALAVPPSEYIYKTVQAEVEYLRKRRLKAVSLSAANMAEDTYQQFLAYHRVRLGRCLNAGMLNDVRDHRHLREVFGRGSEMFKGLRQLLEETLVEWALKTDRIDEASAALFLYEKEENKISDIRLAHRFNTHFFKTYNFNLVISYSLAKPADDSCPKDIPVALKYMLPGNLKNRTYGRRWKPPRREKRMKGLYSIKGRCRCCNRLEELEFTGRV